MASGRIIKPVNEDQLQEFVPVTRRINEKTLKEDLTIRQGAVETIATYEITDDSATEAVGIGITNYERYAYLLVTVAHSAVSKYETTVILRPSSVGSIAICISETSLVYRLLRWGGGQTLSVYAGYFREFANISQIGSNNKYCIIKSIEGVLKE